MPRQIKGWNHDGHYKDGYSLLTDLKYLEGIYEKADFRVIEGSYFGNWYADTYIKAGAKKKADCVAMFGSAMTFKERGTGRTFGDRITVTKRK